MGYEKTQINKIIGLINKEIYLPAIQRKYVWDDKQITKLMDSILRGYPIGTFLFWNINKTIVNEKKYSMYEFIKDYHERDLYKNPVAPNPFPIGIGDKNIITAILDGQQRLTSLYIALQGSISRKLPNKQWKNDEAFPPKELYFNLHSQKMNEDDDIIYEFKFLTKDEIKKSNEDYNKGKTNKIWYKVKEILQYKNSELTTKVYMPLKIDSDIVAMENIALLHSKLTQEELINYYEIQSNSIDEVLDIFVRVNSGGTVLSKTDLLFSTIVSRWNDARDEIDKLLDIINKKGEGFKFNNDFIMRTCLYILDLSVTLKVENFDTENIDKIRNNWSKISKSIKDTVDLLVNFGFSSETMVSYLSVMPIIYYIYNGGKTTNCKDEIRKYIVVSQLKQIFGAASNSALSSIRKELQKHKKEDFKLKNLYEAHFTGENKSLKYSSEEEVENLFDNLTIGPYTFMVLSLLYPKLKYSQEKFHQDHMHPYSEFENDKIKGLILPNNKEIDETKIKEWKYKRNTLANLQLLESSENESKNDTPLLEWIKEYGKENIKYLPDISYELANFDNFLIKRRKLLLDELKKILL